MSQEEMSRIVDRVLTDAEFRSELGADPRMAAERHGYAITDDEASALSSIGWEGADEELRARVSKNLLGRLPG